MFAKFVWLYLKLLFVLMLSIAIGYVLLGWQYGFHVFLETDVAHDLTFALVTLPIIALPITVIAFLDRGNK